MSDAELASQLVAALVHAAGNGATLVSVEITRVASGAVARIETRVERATRTLKFMAADAFGADGERIASAASVHKLAG